MIAAQVSSQLVSSPRIMISPPEATSPVRAGARRGFVRAPHDHRVLTGIPVIPRPRSGGAKPKALVEGDGGAVGGPDLERVRGVLPGLLEHRRDQTPGDPAPAGGG